MYEKYKENLDFEPGVTAEEGGALLRSNMSCIFWFTDSLVEFISNAKRRCYQKSLPQR